MRVPGLDEREAGEVVRRADRRAALDEPRTGHRRQRFAEKPLRTDRHVFPRAVAQGDIDIGDIQIDRNIAGIDPDVDFRVVALEGFESRNHPHRCERRKVVSDTLLRPAL